MEKTPHQRDIQTHRFWRRGTPPGSWDRSGGLYYPADYCLTALKPGYLEPCFRTIAARAIMAATRGCSNEALETIPYKKIRRPLYPLDPDMEWTP